MRKAPKGAFLRSGAQYDLDYTVLGDTTGDLHMARRRKRSSEERDDDSIASVAAPQALHRATVKQTEDRRQFHPQKELAYGFSKLSTKIVLAQKTLADRSRTIIRKAPSRSVARVPRLLRRRIQKTLRPKSLGRGLPLRGDFKFQIPRTVAICVRRKERREVIFASGKGGSRNISRHRNRNQHSNIRCK